MKKIITFALTVALSVTFCFAQMTKGKKGTFALTNATIVTVSNGTITNGTLIIATDGTIADIGTGVAIPTGAEVIDCSGMFVYPGMIDGGTQLGLIEVGSLPETRDANEIGEITPQVEALTAVNPNSTTIPVTRVSGVTTALTVPSGGLFPGTASLINLHGYTPDQMYAGFKAVRLSFPATGRRGRFDRRSAEDIKKDSDKALKQLNEVWDKAVLYSEIDGKHRENPSNPAPEYYPEIARIAEVVNGNMHLMIEVGRAKDIQSAIEWAKEKSLTKVILSGCSEGWRVADDIAKSGYPVIVGPMLSTPTRTSDRYDRPYANPGIMLQAGVKVAIRTNDSENVRNLPFNAGFAAAYGMGKEEALKAVTMVPAEIFGVADKLGSLEKGKVANLFVADGDPFETSTNISHVFIQGWSMPMDSRHIRLYNEFLQREPGVTK